MKVIELDRLHTADFAISDISVIYQNPTWSTLGTLGGSGRVLNGFLLVDNGSCTYEWAGGSAELEAGSLIYLPCGSKRVVTVTSRPFTFYRISFVLTDICDGERIIFTREPWAVTSNAAAKLYELSRDMLQSTVSRMSLYKSISLMAEFLHVMSKHSARTAKSRVSPAIEYLDSHYTENTDIDELARLCYISKPHLFRLFRAEVGMTPIEYRNHLRVERAKVLLADGECGIGEISTMLGFDGSYYFSRIFKACTGVAPSHYVESTEG